MIKMNIQFFAADPDAVGVWLPDQGGEIYLNDVLQTYQFSWVWKFYVIGNTAYAEGSSDVVVAKPLEGYKFSHWTYDGEILADNVTIASPDNSHHLKPVFVALPDVTYEYITKDGNKVQVDSAIRDGLGNRIDTKYVRFNDAPKYVHYLHIYNAGSDSGSCNCYATIYSTSATKLTATDLINTYTMSNKLYNITGVVSNTNGCNAVGNVFFAGTSEAYFNDGTQTCTGTTIRVDDTILGRLV